MSSDVIKKYNMSKLYFICFAANSIDHISSSDVVPGSRSLGSNPEGTRICWDILTDNNSHIYMLNEISGIGSILQWVK